MSKTRSHRVLGLLGALALCAAAACGTRLLRDPSFELWCGDKL